MRLITLPFILFALTTGDANDANPTWREAVSSVPVKEVSQRARSSCTALNPQQTTVSIPNEWQRINAAGKFTFRLPPDMKQTSVSGVESLLREYTDDRRTLYFVYEPYSYLSYDSRKLDGKQNYEEVVTKISGKKATIFTYHKDEDDRRTYSAELYIGEWKRGEVGLIMAMSGQDQEIYELAKKIFASIRF